MKKLIKSLLVVLIAITMFGCSSTKNDETFVKNLGKGLEARWKLTDNTYTGNMTDADYVAFMKKVIAAETDKIGNLEEYEFTNENIKELATNYVDGLSLQLESLDYFATDSEKYNEIYMKGYAKRVKNIYLINNEMPLSVSSTNQDNLNDFLRRGKSVNDEDAKAEELIKILESGVTATFDGDGNYDMILENTTGYDFESLTLIITFYDKDGIQINDTMCYLSDWKNGSKQKQTFYTYGSDGYDHATISAEYWRTYNENYETAYTDEYPLNLENNYSVNITLSTELPVELSYIGYSGRKYTTVNVTEFRYEDSSWYDGKASVKFYFSGEKTYDNEGDESNNYCYFSWKLYKDDGTVVDTGSVFTKELKNGEKFVDESDTVYNLEPGDYTLELSDRQ